MSRRVLAAAGLAAAFGVTGCGGAGGDGGSARALVWAGKPRVFKTRGLANDRVVIARVHNAGKRTLHLDASKVRVVDADGHRLQASAGYTTTFAHGLFGAYQQPPGGLPASEKQRLGKAIILPPNGTVPFFAAWRLRSGTKEPVTIDYGYGRLAVPRATAVTAR